MINDVFVDMMENDTYLPKYEKDKLMHENGKKSEVA